MLKLVSDVNVEGHVRTLVSMILRSEWSDIWNSMDIELLNFHELGLAENANDRTVWNMLQQKQAILITNNRNNDGVNSLQATIVSENSPDCLPVITISSIDSFRTDRQYTLRAIAKLIEILFDIDLHRGVGRLYIP